MNQFLKKFLKIIFVKDTITNPKTNNFFSLLHTLWFPTAITVALLDTLGVVSSFVSISIILIHFILIIRNINPLMFERKEKIANFANQILKYSILIFIINVFTFSWSFAFGILTLSVFARLLYVDLPASKEKMKQQNQFKEQFGEFSGEINEETIIKKHIENLFEKNIPLESIDATSLKKQFRHMAKIYHPDKNNGEHDDRFHSIKQSYDYLKEKIAR